MNLRNKLKSAYDQVHAPEDVTDRLKQELYQKDLNGDAETEVFLVEEAKRPAVGQYVLYIAAVFALCLCVGIFWKNIQGSRNILHPGSQVIVESVPPSGTPAIEDWTDGVIPDVTNYHYEYALKILEQCGYNVEIKYENNSEVEAGKTIRTEPAGNKALAPGETVILFVSKGGTGEVKMPDCVGMTLEQARVLLESYQIGMVTNFDPTSEELPGTVIAQDAPAGKTLRQNQDSVILTVSGDREKMEKAIYVGDLTGMSEQDATAILNASHVPYTIKYSFSISNSRGTVIGQTRGNYYCAGDEPINLIVAE